MTQFFVNMPIFLRDILPQLLESVPLNEVSRHVNVV